MSMQSFTYADRDGVTLAADLHVPDGPGPHPVLLGIPGGGWRFGSRSAFAGWGTYLASHGYALFAIDHRRSTAGVCYPQAVQDVRAALRWLGANAENHGCDPQRIGIIGSSAGAHLGSLATLSGDLFDPPGLATPAPRVKALALAYGIYDLHTHWQACLRENAASGEDFTEAFLGCTPYDDPMLYVQASPIRHVRYNTAVPVFLTWGTHDDAVSPTQSEAFFQALQQARFFVRACPVVGAGHFWFSDDPIDDAKGYSSFVAPRIVRFLERHLKAVRVETSTRAHTG
jgi:acetyl esterase/lipase